MSSLNAAIENLYTAFSDIAKPRTIDGCPCCFDDEDIAKLLDTPLRQIQPDDISSYASSAFLTVGDTADYLYYLPRILEIAANDDGWWPSPEVTGRAIADTDPANWSTERRETLSEFLRAKVRQLIDIEHVGTIDEWLCGIARMRIDVRPFLEIMETSPAVVAEYYRANCGKLDKGKLSNEFWKLPNEGHDMIVQWLRREDITELGNEYWP